MDAEELRKPPGIGSCRLRSRSVIRPTWQRALYRQRGPAHRSESACPGRFTSSTTNCGAESWMRVNGIVLTAGNPKGLKPLIDEAEERGIRVVCVSTDAPESRRSCIVCVEPRLNGCLAGELMGKFVPPGSQVAVVAGMLDTEDHRKKTDGFAEAFPQHCAGGSIFTVIEGHEDEDDSFQKTFDLLRRAPTLAGLYVNTVNCLPVCRALGAHGLAGKVKLITTDLFAEMAPYFQKGIITASIYQQPHRQGQMAVRLMADHLTNRVPLPPTVHLSPGVVMSSNLNLFREMRIPDFIFDDSALLERAVL